jgi:hypothetical protein
MPPRQKPIGDPEQLAKLREDMERKEYLMHTIKTAYMNSTPFGDHVPSADDVQGGALAFIEANYTYQRALYGKIRLKLSIAQTPLG